MLRVVKFSTAFGSLAVSLAISISIQAGEPVELTEPSASANTISASESNINQATPNKVKPDDWTEDWESDESWDNTNNIDNKDKEEKEEKEEKQDTEDTEIKENNNDDSWEEDWESDDSWDDVKSSTDQNAESTANPAADDNDISKQDNQDKTSPDNSFWGNLDVSGEFAPQYRVFPLRGLSDQHRLDWSIRFEPELSSKWHNDQDKFNAVLFFRQDQRDNERTHWDIRELYWQHAENKWEIKLGISKVFWGVAETRHLVDIVNQTDSVENIDGEAKLGQPMFRLSFFGSLGTLDGYLLPYFREQTFPGKEGRLRSTPRIDPNNVLFESHNKHHHIDWALRWFKNLGAFDIGLNIFRGTSRDPFFIFNFQNGELFLLPTYQIIEEYSTDIQATLGNWLWKFEGLVRRGQAKTFNAQVFGFEYTSVGVFGSKIDLGWLAEYHHDTRQQNLTPFNNDIAVGVRVGINDVNDSEILAFVLYDRNWHSQMYRIEASRRLGDSFKFNLEGTILANVNPLDPLSFIRRDHLVQAELVYYF